jgi:hypothetical protein
MKKNEKLRREGESTMEKIRAIARHIRSVEDNCLLLGEKLISQGDIALGRQLIANGYVHDASKFFGIEFDFMSPGQPTKEDEAKLKLKLAIQHHQKTNLHHPEAWAGGIKDMPDVYLAEFVCDTKARSEEFGTDFRQWIDNEATKKYGFTTSDKVYRDLMRFVDLLCAKPFENITQS